MDIIEKAMGIYCFVIISTGTIANIFGAMVCMRKKLRNVPTFRFFVFIFIFDIFALYPASLNNSVNAWFGIELVNISVNLSRWFSFAQFFSGNVSSWILIITTVERYVAVKVKLWRKVYFNVKKATYLGILVIICTLAINLPLLILKIDVNLSSGGGVGNTTLTPFEIFISTPTISLLYQIISFESIIVPIGILVTTNCFLITETTCVNKNVKRINKYRSKRRKLTITVVLTTTSYILLNVPGSVLAGFFLDRVLSLPYGDSIVFGIFLLNFSNFGTNFYILLFSNKSFRNEFKTLISDITASVL